MDVAGTPVGLPYSARAASARGASTVLAHCCRSDAKACAVYGEDHTRGTVMGTQGHPGVAS